VLHHVSIEVLPADAERFGEMLGLIGFQSVEAPEVFGGAIPWYEREGTQVHLIITEGATAPALGHAAFVAPDFEATVSALEAAGFEVEEHQQLWGEKRSFVLAPGGHRVEIVAAPPEPSV
jgi:catechol 2,3-dioxygenase-like lactoylglutathione lyase family enzyme